MHPLFKRFQRTLSDLEKIDGKRYLPDPNQAKGLINLTSNDYLGLSADKTLKTEFCRFLEQETTDFSSSSSRLLTGNLPIYGRVEHFLVKLFDKEAALVFNSGYHCNMGILPALAHQDCLILSDELNHASIIDGIRLSKAKCECYPHNNLTALEAKLEAFTGRYEAIFIVTESLFSMDGDKVDLKNLVALKERYPEVLLYIDEAHAFGLYGTKGLGCAEEQGVIEKIDFLVATLGKALYGVGGFVVSSALTRDYLINHMRSLIFTTALPPINWAWNLYLLQRLAHWQDKRKHLALISSKMHQALGRESGTHILPFVLGDNQKAVDHAIALQKQGFYVLPIRYPSVPRGTARLRLSLHAGLSTGDIDNLISALTEL